MRSSYSSENDNIWVCARLRRLFRVLCLLALVVLGYDARAQEVNAKLVKRPGIGAVYSVAWSPDGKLLSAGTSIGVCLIEPRTLDVFKTLEGYGDAVYTTTFSPDSFLLASGDGDNTVRIWRVSDGRCIASLERHRGPVNSVAFSPDGSLIASGSRDGTIRLWEISGGRCVATLKGHGEAVSSVAFNADGSLVVSGSWDGTIGIWRIESGDVDSLSTR